MANQKIGLPFVRLWGAPDVDVASIRERKRNADLKRPPVR